jgi:signal transduction histidine kinase
MVMKPSRDLGAPAHPGGSSAPTHSDARATLRLVKKREHSLGSLFELSHELSVSLDLSYIADLGLLNLMGHFGTPRGALWLIPDDTSGRPVLIRAHGVNAETARAIGLGLAPRLAELYHDEMRPTPLEEWDPSAQWHEVALAAQTGLALLAPVPSHGRLLGLIALGVRATGERYADLDRDYVATAAGMVGVALENTRLYHHSVEQTRRLRDAVSRLEEADRLKSEFLQTINHELRTPLAIVQAYASCLLEDATLEAPQRQALGIMIEQTKKLTGMVQNLLDFSRLAAGNMPLALEPTDVGALLGSYAEARRSGVVSGLREFSLELDERLPSVRVDIRRLEQMLDALLENAVKFTPHGTRIRLRARRGGEDDRPEVRIELEDDGPGILPQHLPTLFEPLRQVDGSSTRTVGGMGLGLALVKQLAERMDGRLDVRSEVGSGTTFVLSLPAA